MTTDHTQRQSQSEQEQARDLSLRSSRPPVEVPGYEAHRLLGRGAYGEVWVGLDKNTGRRVAIKFFAHRSGVDWTLLSREVEKLVFLSADRYIVQLLDVGWDSEPPYYVMEYIDNGSLDDLLRRQGPLSLSEATEMFTEIAVGLLHAHGKGVLHCDLKPANVLLDQDHQPRLADFGQSRLSHEQSPSLGTLFYMAPEQADLSAVPDARWDVYALGAILYCLLTGTPPFRSPETVRRIEEAHTLEDRLAAYQAAIRKSPPPAAHRKVRRIDRALVEIVDRCLAVEPDRRYANVQAVLDALHAREVARVRWPLLFLGFVGPLLLFVVMAWFGLRGYENAVSESEDFMTRQAHESNNFAAKFAARSIEGEIDRYFHLAAAEAEAPRLHELFTVVAESPLVRRMNEPQTTAADLEPLREEFLVDAHREALHSYLKSRLEFYLQRLRDDPREVKFASLLVVDHTGRMLAAAHDLDASPRSVGWNYSYRTYFNGLPADLSDSHITWQDSGQRDVAPIREPHFSAAFRSTTTGTWKVALSTPIFAPGQLHDEVLGVLALTVNLGDFAYFRSDQRQDRFAVLIDSRAGPNQGVILQHPLFDERDEPEGGLREDYSAPRFRLTAEQLTLLGSNPTYRYQDPLATATGGEPYRGDWIAARAPVRLPRDSAGSQDDAMLVLVQEPYAHAIAPVRSLGAKLKREGLWALLGVFAVGAVLCYVVIRVLSEPALASRRRLVEPTPPTPLHDLSTLPAPSRKGE